MKRRGAKKRRHDAMTRRGSKTPPDRDRAAVREILTTTSTISYPDVRAFTDLRCIGADAFFASRQSSDSNTGGTGHVAAKTSV
jgi:hypothetical protein